MAAHLSAHMLIHLNTGTTHLPGQIHSRFINYVHLDKRYQHRQ